MPVVQRLAKAAGSPSRRTSASGKLRRYCGEKQPTEKRFSPVDLLASQASEMRCSVRHQLRRCRPAGRPRSVAPSRCARRCACRSSARAAPSREKSASGTRASSPILSAREAEVDVQRQPLGARLVEDRLAAVAVGDLAEAPDQLLGAAARADRVAERDPAAAGDLIHEEGVAGVAEQQPLVAGQRRVRQRVVRAVDRWRARARGPRRSATAGSGRAGRSRFSSR